MTPLPYARTECSCSSCRQCCTEQPGHLLPGQLARILEYLQRPLADAAALFCASPGGRALEIATGRIYSIRTITPRFDKRRKRCIFLDDDQRCTIHPVAPFGCAYFDTHMSASEGGRRSAWGMRLIQESAEYAQERARLPLAEHYKPRKY